MPRYSAAREVALKSEAQVERASAGQWLARALACYHKYKITKKISWLLRAEQYRHEALEHASGAGDGGKLVGVLERRIAKVRPRFV